MKWQVAFQFNQCAGLLPGQTQPMTVSGQFNASVAIPQTTGSFPHSGTLSAGGTVTGSLALMGATASGLVAGTFTLNNVAESVVVTCQADACQAKLTLIGSVTVGGVTLPLSVQNQVFQQANGFLGLYF